MLLVFYLSSVESVSDTYLQASTLDFNIFFERRKPMKLPLSGRQPILAHIEPTSASFPYMSSFPHKNNSRDASFSSYLTTAEEPNRNLDDSEISIFDAEKYFNESNANNESTKSTKTVSPANLESISEVSRFSSASSSLADGYRNYRTRSFHATPTVSSEASWNSQTGLLTNPPGAIAVSMRNPHNHQKRSGSSVKRLFRRKCPCLGKKAVQVEENSSEANIQTPRLHINIPKPETTNSLDGSSRSKEIKSNIRRISAENRFVSGIIGHQQRVLASSGRSFNDGGSGFTFPILNNPKLIFNGVPRSTNAAHFQDPPRESLEVFNPKEYDKIPRRSFTFPASPKSRLTGTDDDAASDASSDLFEIESFSTQTTSYPNCTRHDSLDDASTFNSRTRFLQYRRSLDEPPTPSVAATECYEPSEVSIDWSVTTAEGFDRASMTNFSISASEVEYLNWRAINNNGCDAGGGGGDGGGGKKKVGGLLSCRCEKAVSVGPHPVKSGSIECQKMGPSSSTRHVSSRGAFNVNRPPLATSRMVLPFAT